MGSVDKRTLSEQNDESVCMTEGDESVHYRAAEAFARRVRDRYGDAVEAVRLYGSVVREEQRGLDFDIDLLVVLEDGVDRAEYERRVRELPYDVELDQGVVLSLQGLIASDCQRGTPFLQQVLGARNGSMGDPTVSDAERELDRLFEYHCDMTSLVRPDAGIDDTPVVSADPVVHPLPNLSSNVK